MISKIFPFFRKKENPIKRKDPIVKADFVVQRFGDSKSNSAAVEDVGKILAKRFDKPRAHDFGTTVTGRLSQVERTLEDIGEDSALKKRREQVEVRVDFKPGRQLRS